MIRRPPRSTRTDTLFPYTTLFRSLVRVADAHMVGGGEVLEAERGRAVLALGPFDAVGPQRVGQPHHVEQVPARVAAAPLAFVGIAEVAEQARSEERRVGNECVSTCRSRCSP